MDYINASMKISSLVPLHPESLENGLPTATPFGILVFFVLFLLVFFFLSICLWVVWIKTFARTSHVRNLIKIFPFSLLYLFSLNSKRLYQDGRWEVVPNLVLTNTRFIDDSSSAHLKARTKQRLLVQMGYHQIKKNLNYMYWINTSITPWTPLQENRRIVKFYEYIKKYSWKFWKKKYE